MPPKLAANLLKQVPFNRINKGDIYSEFSADEIEFSNACKKLFIENKNQGFHAYLQENPLITIQGKTFKPASWLMTHGSYDEENGIVHGVEYVHLETGFIAAAMMVAKAPPEQREEISALPYTVSSSSAPL